MSDVKLTPEQEEAIFSTGKNILVSASAGSGKTFVMANRIVEKIRSGVEINQLFISTFTKKAAAELKIRLERDLKRARLASDENEERHRFTLALQGLQSADIGTMDSFTQKLVRQYFNRINVDPNFRILADKTESDLIKQDVFDQLVENHLSEELVSTDDITKDDFKKLVKNFSKDRNINGFQSVVYSVYNFMSSTENPMEWLETDFLKAYDTYQKFTDLPQKNLELTVEAVKDFVELLETSLTNKVISGKTGVAKANAFLDHKDVLLSTLTEKNFGAFADLFIQLDTVIVVGSSKDETLGAMKKDFSAQRQVLIGSKSTPGIVFDFYNQVKHGAIIEKYQPQAYQIVVSLQKFMRSFYQAYLEQKINENAFEYADISHFAIEILEENPDIREELQQHYDEIMIDEYQDTNHTQERMLVLLSNGHNLFMVGDIKQSIYGFRLADPGLFLEKYKSYDQPENPNQLIRLKENFRSRGEVLNFTNQVFKHLMDEEIGEMTYGQEEKLVQGNLIDYPSELTEEFYPELLLYSVDTEKDSDKKGQPDTSENVEVISDGEIRIAAQRIVSLLNSGVNPKDIALLVRSKSNNNKIEEILTSYDIPVVLDEGRVDFLKSIEVLVMLDVLRAIDNPLYDISLVAMLRSPLFEFNEDELTRISLQGGKDTRFWEKVLSSLTEEAINKELITVPLKAKIQSFVNKFTEWRKLVNQISIHELLWKIYIDTYYYDYVGALSNGDLRQANLQALSVRAESYESSGYKGLFKFIRLIDRFMEQNNDLAAVNIKLPENAVRVMTFHKSKGLEFDHVFLMNLQSSFNQSDLSEKVIITRKNGLGIKYVADLKNEPDVQTEFPYALAKMDTLPYIVNKETKKRAGLSEEMRVLYVALTRAKQKLYLIGATTKKGIDSYADAVLEQTTLINKYRDSANGFQHWILALQAATKLSVKMNIYTKDDLVEHQTKYAQPIFFENLIEQSTQLDGIMQQSDDIKRANEIMTFQYPEQAATQLASIQTPSQVKKRSYEKQLELGEVQPVTEFVRAKTFGFTSLQKSKVSATEVGSATHSFMQEADFSNPTLEKFQKTLHQLSISDELKKKINLSKLLTLFDTDLGKILIDNVDNTVKEAPFSMLKTDQFAKDQYIVRGICDGYILLDDRIILFDYKTDYFNKVSAIAEIKARYQVQMDLYAEALQNANPNVNQVDKYLILLGGPDKVLIEKLD